jgi:hypothetical protein
VVCTRVPGEAAPSRFVTQVHTVDATTNVILELVDHLRSLPLNRAADMTW